MTDYLVLGSGLSALVFSALMAKAGHKVVILEAHELPGGYGHTFIEKNKNHEYHFNAQLHYVWDCGEGEPVNNILKKLSLEKSIPFVKYHEDGFDHMRIPGFNLNIPNSYKKLTDRLCTLFPKSKVEIINFLTAIKELGEVLKFLRNNRKGVSYKKLIKNLKLLEYYNLTLQQVFNKFNLPKEAQSLLASQWPDFLLPPNQLSFFCWLVLFDGYMSGAYYPKHHFKSVIDHLVDVVKSNGGEVHYNQTVFKISHRKKRIQSVTTRNTLHPDLISEFSGKNIICNFDPKVAAEMIGIQHFSEKLRKKLDYTYSASNFVIYGAVEGIDLRQYGFGNWNIFHSEQPDINKAFNDMYQKNDFSKPAFGITTPSLMTTDTTGCPEGQQLFEMLTVANYSIFEYARLRSIKDYNKLKNSIYHQLLDIIERDYVPNFRKHISFKMIGTPTTNTSYCFSPFGNSYGMSLTPENMRISKLNFLTSFKNFYFCNAVSGYPGFAKAFTNGANLYEILTGEGVF